LQAARQLAISRAWPRLSRPTAALSRSPGVRVTPPSFSVLCSHSLFSVFCHAARHVAGWFASSAHGEARPGAVLTYMFERFGLEVPYQVLEAEPGCRLVLRGEAAGRAGVVAITLARDGGETVLHLVNSGFLDGAEWDEEYEGTRSGWAIALDTMRAYVEGHFGEPRREILTMRQAAFEPAALGPLYATPEGRARWMGPAARFVGSVRVDTGQELLFESPALGGLLELKAFSWGGERRIALRGTAWGPAPSSEVEPELRAALDRLAAAIG
jgi:hypothetical protein